MAKYRFGAVIGSGGFGTVKEATRIDDDYRCVVKILNEDADENAVARFKREVRLQSQLNPILGTHLNERPYWYAMPRADGNLRGLLPEIGDGALDIFVEIARGVEHAHDNGVVHRDLKPDNVLIFREPGRLRTAVADFGLGKFLHGDSTTLTGSGGMLGTL
jgi:eukaryotic-like serine/threonine-protein kinase